MKYLDYLFLLGAGFMVFYLATRFESLSWMQIGLLLVAILFAAFQFGLRSQMRKSQRKKEEEK